MDFAFVGGGADTHDLILGTLLRDTATSNRAWSPTFCGICRDKERNNESSQIKGSYFLSTTALGQHNLAAATTTSTSCASKTTTSRAATTASGATSSSSGREVFFTREPDQLAGRLPSAARGEQRLGLPGSSSVPQRPLAPQRELELQRRRPLRRRQGQESVEGDHR